MIVAAEGLALSNTTLFLCFQTVQQTNAVRIAHSFLSSAGIPLEYHQSQSEASPVGTHWPRPHLLMQKLHTSQVATHPTSRCSMLSGIWSHGGQAGGCTSPLRCSRSAVQHLPLQHQGVPIIVRHIESIIRMSEAHAKMHLRSYVSQGDVDMAIRVLLDSFVSTQKFGVQKALQKNFRKYMTYKKDYNELLLLLLCTPVKDALHFEEIVSGSTTRLTHIEVKVDDLKNKAQEYGIYDLKPFFSIAHFSDNSFVLDEGCGIIRHPIAA